MGSNDHLLKLVRFMSKAEARHFRLHCQLQKGKKSYEYLYDEVSKVKDIEDYDDTRIREKLDEQGKVPARNFAVTKNYLFDSLLKSLRVVNEKMSVDNQIVRLFQEAQLLFGKGIWDKSLERLLKAKKLAAKFQRLTMLLNILSLEIDLAFTPLPQREKLDEKMARLHREKETALKGLIQENEYRMTRNRLYVLMRSRSTSLRKEDIEFINNLKERPALKSPSRFLSFQSELLYHHSWALIYRLQGVNLLQMRSHFRKIIDFWAQHPSFVKEFPRQCNVALFNYLGACHINKDYTEFEEILNRTREQASKTILEQTSDFHNYYHYRLLFLMNTMQYEAAQKLAEELEAKIGLYRRRSHPLRTNKLLPLYHNIAVLLFTTEHFKEAEKWALKIRTELRQSKSRKDIQYFSRVLQLIILFEQGEDDLLDNRAPYLMKLIREDKMLLEFDETVLRYLQKLSKSHLPKKDREIYQAFLKDIEVLEDKLKLVCGQKEVKRWVKSKLTGKSMATLMKEESQS